MTQKIRRFTALSFVALFSSTLLISSINILPVSAASTFSEMSVNDKAQAWVMGRAVSECIKQRGFETGNKNSSDMNDGEWLNGQVGYDDPVDIGEWAADVAEGTSNDSQSKCLPVARKTLEIMGVNATEAICEMNKLAGSDEAIWKRDNGDCLSGSGDLDFDEDSHSKNDTQIWNKYFTAWMGSSGVEAALTNGMRYIIYSENFFQECSKDNGDDWGTPREWKSSDNEGDKVYKLKWNKEGATPDKDWYVVSGGNGRDHEVHIDGYGMLYNDDTAKCSELASKINEHAAAAIEESGGDASTLTSTTGSTTNNSSDQCDASLNNPLTWIVCPLVDLMQTGLDSMDSIIRALMFTPIEDIFTDETRQTASVFRNMALALVVIAGLVMVISQAIGVQILDAYTIKRVFPRLFIAGIGISLSYPLLLFFIGIFNDFGIWGHDLVIQAFGSDNVGTWQSIMNGLLLNGAVAAGAFIYGPAMLTFLATALLAMLIGVVVLALRQLIIIVAVLMAPLAIACYILPGTQKVWEFWKGAILTALLAFPIITMFLAAGKGLSGVLNATSNSPILHIMALFVYIAPYFLIPFAFKLAGGLMSTVFSMANDSSRGGFDRLKNMRGNAAAGRHKDRMEGNTQFGTGRTGRAYRRAVTGNLNPTARGRERFNANERILANRSAAAALEADGGRAVGDDNATLAAVHATSRNDFTRRYVPLAIDDENKRRAKLGIAAMSTQEGATYGAEQARIALTTMEQGLGAEMGTSTMRVSAFKARAASSTAYSGDEAGAAQRINEGAELINAGLITSADATAAGKGNRARLDISGNGFGSQMSAFDTAATNMRSGGVGMDIAAAEAYLDETLRSAEPGDLLAGNNRTVDAMAPAMIRKLQAATTSGNQMEIDRALGQIAGVQDNLNRTSPDKAAIFADKVMSAGVSVNGGAGFTTVRKAIADASSRAEGAGGSQTFLEVRKEYGSATAAAAATPPPPPGGAPPPPPPSDRRLKRDITPLEVSNGIQLYSFRYIWSNQEYVGVMAQDLIESHPEALVIDDLGYYRVNYEKLGLRMYTIEEWSAEKSTTRV